MPRGGKRPGAGRKPGSAALPALRAVAANQHRTAPPPGPDDLPALTVHDRSTKWAFERAGFYYEAFKAAVEAGDKMAATSAERLFSEWLDKANRFANLKAPYEAPKLSATVQATETKGPPMLTVRGSEQAF